MKRYFAGGVAMLSLLCSMQSSAHEVHGVNHYAVYDTGLFEVIKGVRWSQAEEVLLEFDGETEIAETPVFKPRLPYRFQVKNVGDKEATIMFPELMRTSAVKQITSGGMTVFSPFFDEITLDAGASAYLLYVPTEDGVYDVRMLNKDDLLIIESKIEVRSEEAKKRKRKLRR